MSVEIGSKYRETAKELESMIKNDPFSAIPYENILKDKGAGLCYFCKSPIKGKWWVLSNKDTEETFTIGDDCYQATLNS